MILIRNQIHIIHLLKDHKFSNGFSVSHTISNVYNKDMIVWKFRPGTVRWKICQWGSKFPLGEQAKITCTPEFRKISNPHKKIIRYNDGSLEMILRGYQEYDHDRLPNEGWPHLLIEQSFRGVTIHELKNLNVLIDFDFLSFADHMGTRRTDLHTFQVGWYFCLGNNKRGTKGYKDFFWFGLPFIDTPRLPMGKPYEAQDLGKEDSTAKYIINIDPKRYIHKPTEVNDNFHVEMDILPDIKKAFERAKSMGYLKDLAWENLMLVSTNFGIEDTGTFDGTIKVNKIKIFEE